MYNGIGLSTAKGSGTNGYVERNLSALGPRHSHQNRPRHRATFRHSNQLTEQEKEQQRLVAQAKKQQALFLEERAKKRAIENQVYAWAEQSGLYDDESKTEQEIEQIIREKVLLKIQQQKEEVEEQQEGKREERLKRVFGVKARRKRRAPQGDVNSYGGQKKQKRKNRTPGAYHGHQQASGVHHGYTSKQIHREQVVYSPPSSPKQIQPEQKQSSSLKQIQPEQKQLSPSKQIQLSPSKQKQSSSSKQIQPEQKQSSPLKQKQSSSPSS